MYIAAQSCRLRNDLYCVEWDVKLYYTIPYHTMCIFLMVHFVNTSSKIVDKIRVLCHCESLCVLQSYILKLTSSLSTSTYDYTLPEVQFTANVSYRHFTLRFDAQVCNFSPSVLSEYTRCFELETKG